MIQPTPGRPEDVLPDQSSCQIAGEAKSDESLKEKAGKAANRLSENFDEAAGKARQQANQAANRLRQQGQHVLQNQKERVAEEISHVGAAAHQAADKLDEENDHNLASYVHAAADQLDTMAGYLRDSNFRRLSADASHLARRHPEVFFGGMFVVGMSLARFLKATGRPRHQSSQVSARWGEDERAASALGAGSVSMSAGSGFGSQSTGHDLQAGSGGFGASAGEDAVLADPLDVDESWETGADDELSSAKPDEMRQGGGTMPSCPPRGSEVL